MRRPQPKPTLKGKRVRLRPLRLGDAADLFASTRDAETMRLTGTQRTFTLAEIETWCAGLEAREDRVDLAILRREDEAFLGEVVLNDLDFLNASASFRIALAAAHHCGRGYGTEAARLLLSYGFRDLGLHRVELEVFTFNPRALHVYEKLGFRREGVRRDALWMDGAYHDAIVMGVLAGEWGDPSG